MKLKILELDNSSDFMVIYRGKCNKQFIASISPDEKLHSVVKIMKTIEQEHIKCNLSKN